MIHNDLKIRGLVISGGGSKGAFAGGLVKKLYENGYRWDRFYGTSTGALLNTLIPLNDFDLLEEIYTNVDNRNIFNKPPFNQRGRLNIFRAIWRTITGKTSVGKARNLRRLITSTYTEKKHDQTLIRGKVICACVTNYTKGVVEYAYNTNYDYQTFVDFVFASASVPVAMDLVKINGNEYLDGGVMEHVPLQKAIKDGVNEIDVIILRPNYDELALEWKSKNVINVTMRSMQLMMKEISETDVIVAKLKNQLKNNVHINIFYVPHDLKGNSLVFNPKVMKYWWQSGYRVDVPPYTEEQIDSGLTFKEYRIKFL